MNRWYIVPVCAVLLSLFIGYILELCSLFGIEGMLIVIQKATSTVLPFVAFGYGHPFLAAGIVAITIVCVTIETKKTLALEDRLNRREAYHMHENIEDECFYVGVTQMSLLSICWIFAIPVFIANMILLAVLLMRQKRYEVPRQHGENIHLGKRKR